MSARITRTQRAVIFRTSKRILKGVCFDVRVVPVEQSGPSTLFLVVPRAAGNAVERNKIKRRARALFYEKKLSSCGYHWILFAKSGAAQVSFGELQHLFETVSRLLRENLSW